MKEIEINGKTYGIKVLYNVHRKCRGCGKKFDTKLVDPHNRKQVEQYKTEFIICPFCREQDRIDLNNKEGKPKEKSTFDAYGNKRQTGKKELSKEALELLEQMGLEAKK